MGPETGGVRSDMLPLISNIDSQAGIPPYNRIDSGKENHFVRTM